MGTFHPSNFMKEWRAESYDFSTRPHEDNWPQVFWTSPWVSPKTFKCIKGFCFVYMFVIFIWSFDMRDHDGGWKPQVIETATRKLATIMISTIVRFSHSKVQFRKHHLTDQHGCFYDEVPKKNTVFTIST